MQCNKTICRPALFMSASALMTQCLFGIMRKMPVECAAGKIQKLVNAIRAEGGPLRWPALSV